MKMEQLSVGRPLFNIGDRVRLVEDVDVWKFDDGRHISYKKGQEGKVAIVVRGSLEDPDGEDIPYYGYQVDLDAGNRTYLYQAELELVIRASLENV